MALTSPQRLQFRPLVEKPGWDLSCQHVEGPQLSQLEPQLQKDRCFQDLAEDACFQIDLSLNELTVQDLPVVLGLLQQHKNLAFLVADNQFSWDDLRTWLQSQQLSNVKDVLRLVKQGRLSMASTLAHHAMQQVVVNQALTDALLTRAAATLSDLTDRSAETRKRHQHEDFGLEKEVHRALTNTLKTKGYTDVIEPGFKAIKGLDGKDAFSFDGTLLATKGDTQYLFVGEVKQYLKASHVLDAEADRAMLAARLVGIKDGTTPKAHQLYNMQTEFLRGVQDATVVLYVGGATVLPEARTKAEAAHCLLVAPGGGRYQVTFPDN